MLDWPHPGVALSVAVFAGGGEELYEMFCAFATFGAGSAVANSVSGKMPAVEMDGAHWIKVLRECGLLDGKTFGTTAADLVFVKAKPKVRVGMTGMHAYAACTRTRAMCTRWWSGPGLARQRHVSHRPCMCLSRLGPLQGMNKIDFGGFKAALQQVAEAKGMAAKDLHAAITGSQGPLHTRTPVKDTSSHGA